MINYLLGGTYPITAFLGILCAFGFTCLLTSKLSRFLPKDAGREFAHDGKLSAGKPRGAGIIFVCVFVASALLFGRLNVEILIYLGLVLVEMLTGYLDDASDKPWGEFKKGILDFVVAVAVAATFVHFHTTTVEIATFGISVAIPPVVFYILAIILVWGSINVTNCADGVDGLSGTLTLITLGTLYVVFNIKGEEEDFPFLILLFMVCILGYLWYNATPSRLLMGDAGSRAMGIFISIAVLMTGSPFFYLLAAFVLMMDGGLGLLKVSLLRFFKIRILKNTTTPLHDHVRKKLGWSNTQTVFRFAIIQIVISVAAIYMMIL